MRIQSDVSHFRRYKVVKRTFISRQTLRFADKQNRFSRIFAIGYNAVGGVSIRDRRTEVFALEIYRRRRGEFIATAAA